MRSMFIHTDVHLYMYIRTCIYLYTCICTMYTVGENPCPTVLQYYKYTQGCIQKIEAGGDKVRFFC